MFGSQPGSLLCPGSGPRQLPCSGIGARYNRKRLLVGIEIAFHEDLKNYREGGSKDPDWGARAARRRRLEALGISFDEYKLEAPASALLEHQSFTRGQRFDQWLLIGSSAFGVVCLALSLIV